MKNDRLNKFRECLGNKGIECALIFSDTNRNYLSGFTGNESYIIITKNKALFITDSRYIEQAINETVGFEVKEYSGRVECYLSDTIKSLGIHSLGFEENFMNFQMYDDLKGRLEGINFIKLGGIVEKIRQIKSDAEIKNIEEAASIADRAYSHMLKYIKSGMTEIEIGLELEFFMRSNGASKLSFESIVASGKRSSLPHGAATGKVVEDGDFLTLDFGCVYNGYCSDMTRTIVLGKASDKQKSIYNAVLEANETALKYIKPGITGIELDRIARDTIIKRGYSDSCYGHGLGHGVGMDIHELPFVSKKGIEPLAAGMVITDEPGIYIPGYGGVRIEDLVVVTQEGCKILSKSDKNLIELY